jgi:hypothetical protein
MWQLYADRGAGIAITTSYSRLANSLGERVYLGMVQYIDYDRSVISENNRLFTLMSKRKSFEHEREVRALISDRRIMEDLHLGTEHFPEKSFPRGVHEKVNIHELIDKVFVSPKAPPWELELICDTVEKFGYRINVDKSDLFDAPIH